MHQEPKLFYVYILQQLAWTWQRAAAGEQNKGREIDEARGIDEAQFIARCDIDVCDREESRERETCK